MKKLLLTGFGAFHTHKSNPTSEIVGLLENTHIGPYRVYGKILPVEFKTVFSSLQESINQISPDVILLTGLAHSRSLISLERVAINHIDSLRKDNTGLEIHDSRISPNGKNAYFSTLPLNDIFHYLANQKIPVEISNTAGTYICNQIMYQCLEYLEKQSSIIPSGFIHLPPDKQLKVDSKWEIKDLADALKEVINALK